MDFAWCNTRDTAQINVHHGARKVAGGGHINPIHSLESTQTCTVFPFIVLSSQQTTCRIPLYAV